MAGVALLPLSGILSGVTSLVTVAIVAWKYGIPLQHDHQPAATSTAEEYIPIVFVTIGSICLLYTFFYIQSYTTFAEYARLRQQYQEKKIDTKPSLPRLKYGKDNNGKILVANRTVQNLLEQIIPFLISLWLYATYVNVKQATCIGWMWILFRSYYKIAYQNGPMLFLSTIPSYICIWYMLGYTVYTISQ